MIDGHGNSTSEISYHYNDERPLAGISYYRLKQVDHNGNYKYSDIQIIDRKTLNGYRIYPQPATDEIKITSEIGEISSLEIIDLLGKKSTLSYKVINGEYILDISALNAGISILNIYNGQEVISEKIIKN
ncbi:MAG: T9SS type A sorting domain-containing protein [Bacteroidota bacterium]